MCDIKHTIALQYYIKSQSQNKVNSIGNSVICTGHVEDPLRPRVRKKRADINKTGKCGVSTVQKWTSSSFTFTFFKCCSM